MKSNPAHALLWLLVSTCTLHASFLQLSNPGLETPYTSVPMGGPDQKAKITGSVAQGWIDNSAWADVDAHYSSDTLNPHGGKACQRIAITRVGSGFVQITQHVTLKKGIYALHAWLRGDPQQNIILTLRLPIAPYTAFAEKICNLSPEWQEFTLSATVPGHVEAGIFLECSGPTKFWLDDVSLEDVTHAVSSAPVQPGNLFSGGSFEAGLSFGWSVRLEGPPRHAFADPRPVSDGTTAMDGKRSLRIDIPEGDSLIVTSPIWHPTVGRSYTLGIDLKASAPDTPVQIVFDNADSGAQFQVGTQWRRYTWTGVFPYLAFTHMRVRCSVPEGGAGGSLWIDGVQLEESDHASPYHSPFSYDLTLHVPRPGSIVFDGEKGKVLVTVAPPPPAGSTLRLSAVDLYGGAHHVAPVALPADSFPLPNFASASRGLFKLTGQLMDASGKALSSPVDMVWARLPRPRAINPRKSFFGIHTPLSPEFIAIARATGQRWIRLHDTSLIGKWAAAEPIRGDFNYYDDAVDAAHTAGEAILGMLDGAPAWTTRTPRTDGAYWSYWNFPDSVDDWRNYVQHVTGHYRGRIDDWEIWNEPWGKWWATAGGKPSRYVELMKAAYATAKQANPKVNIIGVDAAAGDPWTEEVLALSGTNCFDSFSFHDYQRALFGGPEPHALKNARYFNAIQAKYGSPRPLWNTEGGPSDFGSFYAPETGGMDVSGELAQAVRFDVTQIAAGIRVYCVYAMPTDPGMGDVEFCANEFDRSIKSLLVGRAVLASLIDGATSLGRREPMPGVDAYDFQQGTQKITVLWSYDGAIHDLPIVSGSKALDGVGNAIRGPTLHLGFEPVYLVNRVELHLLGNRDLCVRPRK